MKEATGTCAFCMQGRLVQMTDEEWQQYGQMAADKIAGMECNCTEGKAYRERMKSFEICERNIEDMIGKKWPEVADLLNEAKNLVYNEEKIRKIQITLPGGDGVIALSYGNTGLKVTHRKVLQTELSSGY